MAYGGYAQAAAATCYMYVVCSIQNKVQNAGYKICISRVMAAVCVCNSFVSRI